MTRRIKLRGRKVGYHAVTRTVHREFWLNDHMKKFFIDTLIRMNRMYYCEISHFCCMSNHTHLLIRFLRPGEVDPDSAILRWNEFHRDKYRLNRTVQEHREYVVDCLTDISHFMKKLNTLMTREYNRKNGHTGTLWQRRFRSSLVERGKAMLMTGAYIDLNSFRASLVARPEDYRYSSLYWLRKGNPGDLIEADIFDETLHISRKTGVKPKEITSRRKRKTAEKQFFKVLYKTYLRYIYKQGTKPPKRKLIKGRTDSIKITEEMEHRLEEKLGPPETGELTKGYGLCRKVGSFTRGGFIGSRGFAKAFYVDHVDPGYEKAERSNRHITKWLHSMAEGVWGVFNGSRTQGMKGVENEDRDNGKGENTKTSGEIPPDW